MNDVTRIKLSDREIGRRTLLKAGVSAAVTAATLQEAGCTIDANQWIQIALTDLPTILQIITSIVSVAKGGNVPPAVLAQINSISAQVSTDLQTAQQLISSYKAKKDTGLLSQIDNALTSAQEGLNSILTALHIEDQTLQVTIAAALGSAITVVTAIISLVPPPPAASAKRVALAKSKKDEGSTAIKESFNVIVGKRYPQAVLQ